MRILEDRLHCLYFMDENVSESYTQECKFLWKLTMESLENSMEVQLKLELLSDPANPTLGHTVKYPNKIK